MNPKSWRVILDVQSQIQFSNDTDYWQANSFPFVFQNVTSFFKLGGHDVNLFGGGTFDGNGQIWYDLYAKDIYTLRPVLFGLDGLHDSTISNLVLRYSPQYYYFIANSTNVVFDNIDIAGESKSANVAKNTDGVSSVFSLFLCLESSRGLVSLTSANLFDLVGYLPKFWNCHPKFTCR